MKLIRAGRKKKKNQYRPTALFVLPFTLSFAIVLVTAFALVRHIATPSKLAPFRVLALPADDNPHRRRRTLLAGRTLWSWGALVFACREFFLSLSLANGSNLKL